MIADSRISIIERRGDKRSFLYSTSDSLSDVDVWIQEPISRQLLAISRLNIVDGIYSTTRFVTTIIPIEPELVEEFGAWDVLSDEALATFEAECG